VADAVRFDAAAHAAHGLVPSRVVRPIPGGPQTVAAVLDRPVAEHPDREALVGRHARYGYAELDALVNRAAHGLARAGVRPFDRVAASLGNHTEIVVAFLACMRLGAIWLGVNRALAPPEKVYVLGDAGASLLLCDPDVAGDVGSRRGDLADLRTVVEAPPGAESPWTELVAAAGSEDRPVVEVDPAAPAAIAYTSGTTGFPKGAVHSQRNMVLPGRLAAAAAGTSADFYAGDRIGVSMPLTTLNLLILGPVLAAQSAKTVVCMDRRDVLGIAGWIRDERIETLSIAPTTVNDLLTHPEVTDGDLASLVRPGVGGGDLPEALRRLYRERFGMECSVSYGLTEAPTLVAISALGERPVPGSSGRAQPHVSVHVLATDGRRLGPGEIGELCVGPASDGPWADVYTPFLGYWNRSDATAAALAGGLLHTGDIGSVDADGNVFVKDRTGDVVVRGGTNVYPAEVERVLHDDDRVAACAVVGRPDERLGERVVAFVQRVQVEGRPLVSEAELRERCLAQLARSKVPEEWIFVDELPRTPTGKIRKPELRARLETS
jgi:acyl-CoA synthetase (AMP-forming)/AMP-acid ligase II